jgi:hypothetical protein
MKKIIILIALLSLVLFPQKSEASEKTVDSSAKLASQSTVKQSVVDTRVKALENVFEKYNSPLAKEALNYVKYADSYGVDWKLLPAISGLESSFGIHLMPGSHNAYGWGGGHIYFASWEEGINTINQALRKNYMDKWGATDVWSIGPIYAESPTWAIRVNIFMREIEEEYKKLSTFAVALNI